MRNISSASYFEQMKGRGSRVIDPNDLQSVTPDTKSNTHYVIVDAVGVCERDKTVSKPLNRCPPSVTLGEVIQKVAQGMVHADVVSTLAARLARLDRSIDDGQRATIAEAAGGKPMLSLSAGLPNSLDPDPPSIHEWQQKEKGN